MKKPFPFDDVWIFAAADVGDGAPDRAGNLVVDLGEPLPLAAEPVTSVVTSAAKPASSIATLADYLVNGFWQYNNTIAHHWASNTITYNISGLNSAEQFLALSAMQAWSEVANITFAQTSGSANITFSHNGSMQAVTNASWYGNGSIAWATVNISTDWVTTDGGAYDGKTGIDSYAYQTYLHEIGHALGLGHQGPYNGSASYSANAIYANDTWQYSLMSYFSEPNYSGSSYRYVVTPQVADIYAMVSMYGAATSTRIGDTVYGFNSNAGAVFNFGNYSSAPALTIYDGGGADTLDCSGYSAAQTIDLHSGAFSSIGGLVNNIGIALNAVIEKAIGGSGNDKLIASDSGCTLSGGGGNDALIGGGGNDKLIGGSGTDNLTGGSSGDTFAFDFADSAAASGQHDRITDFVSGADRIDLSGVDAISSTAGHQQFKFIGTAAFSGTAGELNYFYNNTTGLTTLQGDTNGDGVADFAIDFTGSVNLVRADFLMPTVWKIGSIADFNGDNSGDVLWQNDDGRLLIWDSAQPAGANLISGAGAVPSSSYIVGAADFDGNGRGDILWRNDNGVVSIWDDGSTGAAHDVGSVSANSHIAGIGDFDGNGRDDILWRNDNGAVFIWDDGQASNTHTVSAAGVVPAAWHIAAVGDFDANGRSDILWQNDNGTVSVWDNGQIAGAHWISGPNVVPSTWHILGGGDFDGNGRDDILWQNDNGALSIWDNGQIAGAHIIVAAGVVPNAWHIVGIGDFDNNQRDDILWQNENGTVSIWDNGQIGGAHWVSGPSSVSSDWHIA
ncbi:M10 family metallopeptidase C-terminal domain-containing protein [Bradyrhizobium archetypum]|uniref:Peptidase metallopeptidase domain-containing protein n=1 Tax=Bradyrhizobium archetypum TaxID=2721160 RepID=A0A7Y4H514_9BRAD|nr:M10 family metallopeptidase C-terminal domain-containing protein [Bradyrhizobium archetypum]NOJ47785.1 hypothetical protein [Bradyrhizobium archetypum]